jgi:hypothetical protein
MAITITNRGIAPQSYQQRLGHNAGLESGLCGVLDDAAHPTHDRYMPETRQIVKLFCGRRGSQQQWPARIRSGFWPLLLHSA